MPLENPMKLAYARFRLRTMTALCVATLLTTLLAGVPGAESAKNAPSNPCLSESTIETLVACLKAELPRRGTEGYIDPSDGEYDAWKQVGRTIHEGSCSEQDLRGPLSKKYQISDFRDSSRERTYCVLVERPDANVGWGSMIVDASARSDLIIQVPHPLNDMYTPEWGASLFAETGAHTFMMAGTHRYANADRSADVAHNADSPFQAALAGILAGPVGPGLEVIQLHGMSASTCEGVDVHIANGEHGTPAEGAAVRLVKEATLAHHPEWLVTVTDDEPYCWLNARTNVQARLMIDNAHAACDDLPCTDRFVHIEADPGFRSAADWIPVVQAYRSPLEPEPLPAYEPENPCFAQSSVEAFIGCLKASLPGRDSEGYVAPTDEQRAAWTATGRAMHEGICRNSQLTDVLNPYYELAEFHDATRSQSYCALVERPGASVGWGSMIVNRAATSDFVVQVPHPVYELGTWEWGAGVFAETDAHVFMMAGTHRYANADGSSDVAHNADSPFQAVLAGILSGRVASAFEVMQVHGMGTSTCEGVDVHIANGEYGTPPADASIRQLKEVTLEHHPSWAVTVTDEPPECWLNARTNVQARLMLDQAHPACDDAACTDRFLHIESDPGFRDAADWIPVMKQYRAGKV